jgi:RNA polymerase sigma factor (sigma-70 family)
VETNSAEHRAVESPRFGTTRWSLILSCADREKHLDGTQPALTELCRTYWRPVFAFVCSRGYSVHDSQDLTQDFFVTLLNGKLLSLADPHRGRFRSLLCTALKNFLADNRDKAKRQKRGGGMEFVRWDDWMAEAPSQLSLATHDLASCAPERIFDLRWAATIVEQALRHLSEECASRGRLRLFTLLSKHLVADRSEISYRSLAVSLGVPETAIKRTLHDLRARFRALLREEILQTLDDPADLDDEIRHLCSALACEE